MIYIVEKYFFICLIIRKEEKNIVEKIVLFIYKDNTPIRKNEIFFPFIIQVFITIVFLYNWLL